MRREAWRGRRGSPPRGSARCQPGPAAAAGRRLYRTAPPVRPVRTGPGHTGLGLVSERSFSAMTAAVAFSLLCGLAGLAAVLSAAPGLGPATPNPAPALTLTPAPGDRASPSPRAAANLSTIGDSGSGRGSDAGPDGIVPHCDADEDLFPGSLLNEDQLRHGGVVLYFIFAFYGFCVIALVCENYFLPTVEIICEELGLAPDVAAATFMSLASSAPELFVNVVTTFLTKSTMGVGTTVGSATFNVLGLASFIGLACRAPIQIRALPVLRDSLLYISAIGITTCVVWDGVVEWYEALAMVLCSLAYLAFMFTHHRLARWARSLLSRSGSTVVLTTPRSQADLPDAESASVGSSVSTVDVAAAAAAVRQTAKEAAEPEPGVDPEVAAAVASQIKKSAPAAAAWRRALSRVWLVVSWPVSCLLALTIIDSKKPKLRRFFLLTFILCVVWIALAAYIVSWMLAVIGNTLEISDAVMGITLLAAGGSTPEAVSAIIMSRKGVGSVGIANGLGANTLNMLMNLGMPWLVRSLLFPGMPWSVLSEGLPYELVTLVSAVLVLNLVLVLSRYRLCRVQGVTTFLVYVLFIVMLVLIDLNVFHLFTKSECTGT
ncbi:hypothetical protein ONE63_007193 [Megalurothrips usitatus]|uniref:Sodium/calcium exchanger membrane region domain-containing protein n=1 Tax=Megalurothrips usitatus TaxID=439358 RepID=A0AAV7XXP7_9NEOP|nr:hypothetical protein ONE63_007193 [Megalurothrips usitatus]